MRSDQLMCLSALHSCMQEQLTVCVLGMVCGRSVRTLELYVCLLIPSTFRCPFTCTMHSDSSRTRAQHAGLKFKLRASLAQGKLEEHVWYGHVGVVQVRFYARCSLKDEGRRKKLLRTSIGGLMSMLSSRLSPIRPFECARDRARDRVQCLWESPLSDPSSACSTLVSMP